MKPQVFSLWEAHFTSNQCFCCLSAVILLTLFQQRAAGGHSDFLAACKRRAEGKLSLEHSGTDVQNSKLCNADGPYDVVILDMALSQLVLALMQVRRNVVVGTIRLQMVWSWLQW